MIGENGVQNCWEFSNCGREPGGANVNEFTICPAATTFSANGMNSGKNGGRICWIIADTKYNNTIECSALHHKSSCFSCSFRYKVTMDEGLLNVCKTG